MTDNSATARSRAANLARLFPYLALVIGIVGLAFSAMFVRWANAPGVVTGFYRMSIASLVMLPFVLLRRYSMTASQANAPVVKRDKWRVSPGALFALLAGAGFALDLSLWNTAVNLTTAANATLLTHTSPVLVGLGALVFFKERLTGRFWFGLLLAMSGAFIILGNDFLRHPSLSVGDALALGASIGFAGYFLAAQAGRRTLDALTFFWIYSFSCAVFLLVAGVALGQPFGGYNAQTWFWFLALAVVTQVGGYLSISYAIGHLPASVVSPTMLGQPVLTALLAVPLLGEPLGWPQVLGGGVVIAGVWLVHQARREPVVEL